MIIFQHVGSLLGRAPASDNAILSHEVARIDNRIPCLDGSNALKAVCSIVDVQQALNA